MAGATPPFDPFDPTFRADPYPVYRRLREQDPTHRSLLGFRVFTRYADCAALLHHPDASSDTRNGAAFRAFLEQAPEAARRFAELVSRRRSFLFLDPPDHTRLRGLVSKAFTPRVVEKLRPRIVELVDGLLDAALERGSLEVIEEFAYPIPVVVICELLGVPASDHEKFKGWSRSLARALDPDVVLPVEVLEHRLEAMEAFHHYFRELIDRRRAEPQEDLLSALVTAEDEGDQLSEDELLGTVTLLLVAGHETTVNLIGNGVLALVRHPEALAALAADPSLARSAVEEVLRWDPPVQLDGRVMLADVEIGGVTLERGEQPVILLAAANRDPEQFPDAERFDIERTDNRHLSFGHGIHFCLGAPLARLEGQVALTTIARRLRGLALADPAAPLEYRENLVLRGLARLPVTFATP
ncbi:MAG: cytochrome P450 [Acidimicrobiales bacterium]